MSIKGENQNVGIGTDAPMAKLDVSDVVPILRLTSEGEKSVIGETIGAIEFDSEDASGSYPAVAAAIKAVNGSTFGSQTELAFFINADNPTPTEAVRIDASGQVGIGTDSPTEALHVEGTIKATDINFTGLPVYADEAAAIVGGLTSGDCYKTVTGELRIKL